MYGVRPFAPALRKLKTEVDISVKSLDQALKEASNNIGNKLEEIIKLPLNQANNLSADFKVSCAELLHPNLLQAYAINYELTTKCVQHQFITELLQLVLTRIEQPSLFQASLQRKYVVNMLASLINGYKQLDSKTFVQLITAIRRNPGSFLRKQYADDAVISTLDPLANYGLRRLIANYPINLDEETRFNYLRESCQSIFDHLLETYSAEKGYPLQQLNFLKGSSHQQIMPALYQVLHEQGWHQLSLLEISELVTAYDPDIAMANAFTNILDFYLRLHQAWLINGGWAQQNDMQILHLALGLPDYRQHFYEFQANHADPSSRLGMGLAAGDGNCYLTSVLLVAQCAQEFPQRVIKLL